MDVHKQRWVLSTLLDRPHLVKVENYGTEGCRPRERDKILCPNEGCSCVSGSGGSMCGGFWGHVGEEYILCHLPLFDYDCDGISDEDLKSATIQECENLKKLIENLSIGKYSKFKRQFSALQIKCHRIVDLSNERWDLYKKAWSQIVEEAQIVEEIW